MALAISASIFGKDITGRIHDEPLPRDTLSISPPALTFCSAEAFQNRFFRPGGRVGGKRRHSQEIRKIHVDAINGIFLSSRQHLAYICFLPLIRTAGKTLFITTQIEVPFRLPANENQNILPLRSKDWTFPDETILFGA